MTCISYGLSIKNQKRFKTIRTDDMDNTIKYHGPHVAKYNDKVVTNVQCVSDNFYDPRYAKRLLDNYHNKMNQIKEIVDILYCNIDSILVTVCDHKRLLELGDIDDNEFGKFRVEHIFPKFAIKNCRTWIGNIHLR